MNVNRFFFEISPLTERHFTGISNVACELACRFLKAKSYETVFFMGRNIVPLDEVEKLVVDRSGEHLHPYLNGSLGDRVDYNGIALFSNVKQSISKPFKRESQIFYDLSPLLVPEFHTQDTVEHHVRDLEGQINSSDVRFSISESTKWDLISLFNLDGESDHVIPLGVGLAEQLIERVASQLEGMDVDPYFIMLGTIEPRKNIRLVLRWLQINQWALEQFKFVFIGREGWGETFSELMGEYDLAAQAERGTIRHFGYVSESVKASLLAGSTALLFPSFFEGFGLPVLEAMRLRVPVIATCTTSIPEILGDCGYYFNPENVDSFDAAMRGFLNDRAAQNLQSIISAAESRSREFHYDAAVQVIEERFIFKYQND